MDTVPHVDSRSASGGRPLRVAIFTDSFYPELGGIQDSIAATARALGAAGHRILICAPRAAPREHRRLGVAPGEIDLGPNVSVRRLASLPVPSSSLQSRLVLPTGRRWRALADFAPDLIHAHTFLAAGWEARRAARRLGVPCVGSNHWAVDAFAGRVPLIGEACARAALRAVTRFYEGFDRVTAPSQTVLDRMRDAGLRSPQAVVSNPIDTALFRPAKQGEAAAAKQRFGLAASTVLYAGRLAPEKGIDVLIRALARLAPRHPGLELALAGHGSAEGALRDLARSLGVASRVRFLGTLGQPALAEAMRGCELFALASTSETQSMVLLQAMACGVPAVGARAQALPEFITREVGRLAAPGDAEGFAAQIGLLLDRPGLRERLGRQARAQAQRFALDTVAAQWSRLYAELLAQPRAAAAAPPRMPARTWTDGASARTWTDAAPLRTWTEGASASAWTDDPSAARPWTGGTSVRPQPEGWPSRRAPDATPSDRSAAWPAPRRTGPDTATPPGRPTA